MNSIQYEEFCRYFLSIILDIDIHDIQSVHITNPKRPGLPEYKHQIDLYWENSTELADYFNIANAKWRSNTKIDQPDVLLLQKVKEKAAAHKAFILTNSSFTEGAKAVALDEGIALHVVRPNFDYSHFDKKDRNTIIENILEVASKIDGLIWESHTYTKTVDFPTKEIPKHIKKLLSGASDKDRFIIRVLHRRLDYLNYVIELIKTGQYGHEDQLPGFVNEVKKIRVAIDEQLSAIKK
jgi:hypothetical protein